MLFRSGAASGIATQVKTGVVKTGAFVAGAIGGIYNQTVSEPVNAVTKGYAQGYELVTNTPTNSDLPTVNSNKSLAFNAGLSVGTPIGFVGSFLTGGGEIKTATALSTLSKEAKAVSFSEKAGSRLLDPNRTVPIDILEHTINNSIGYIDEQGSRAMTYYSKYIKNGKEYNLKVLYDEASNSIWHFHYSRDAMGTLSRILK